MAVHYCVWCHEHKELVYEISGKKVLCQDCIDKWIDAWTRPGTRAWVNGAWRQVSECARCGKNRPLIRRGLCDPCSHTARKHGTIGDYELARDGRIEDYAEYRNAGYSITHAARLIRKTRRTGERYEALLLASGRAVWRAA